MDFAIISENAKIAIELEGYDKTGNGTGKSKKEHDEFNRRIQHLTRLGWKVLPITNAQFMKDKMGYANEIRQLIASSQTESVAQTTIAVSPRQRFSNRTVISVVSIAMALAVVIVFMVGRNSSDLNRVDDSPTQISSIQTFENCSDLKGTFPNGIARDQEATKAEDYTNQTVNGDVYFANRKMDRDNDGVMCE
jgi:hypothetical protein